MQINEIRSYKYKISMWKCHKKRLFFILQIDTKNHNVILYIFWIINSLTTENAYAKYEYDR